MADIFDLARSINRQKQSAQSGYSSPLEQLPLQIAEMMATRDKEKRVSLKNDSAILSELIKGASTQEEIDSISNLASQYGKDTFDDPSTRLFGNAIEMQANQKKDAYNQFKASAEWLDGQLATEDKKSYFDISQEELINMSYKDISNRIKELEGYTAGMNLGKQLGFKYAKGVNSLETLQNQFGNYEQKLEDAMKAHLTGGKISEEEAMGILLGDFEGTRKTAEATIKSNLSKYTKDYNRLIKLQEKQLGDTVLMEYAQEEGISDDNIKSYIETEMRRLDRAMELEYDRQFLWTGIAKKGGASDFISKVDEDTETKMESLTSMSKGDSDKKLSFSRDKNQDGIPDSEQQKELPETIAKPLDDKEDSNKMSGADLFPVGFFAGSPKKVSKLKSMEYPVNISLDKSNTSNAENIKNKAKALIGATVSRDGINFKVVDTKIVNGKIKLKISSNISDKGSFRSPAGGDHDLSIFNIESLNRAKEQMPQAFKRKGIPYHYDPIKDIYIVSSNEVDKGK